MMKLYITDFQKNKEIEVNENGNGLISDSLAIGLCEKHGIKNGRVMYGDNVRWVTVVNGQVVDRYECPIINLLNSCDGDCNRANLPVKRFKINEQSNAILCSSCAKKFGYNWWDDDEGEYVNWGES